MQGNRKAIWGWYFFDWASQPYNTLLLTFIFGPYITSVMGDGTAAQTICRIIRMLLAVNSLLAEIGTAGETAGALGCFGHL